MKNLKTKFIFAAFILFALSSKTYGQTLYQTNEIAQISRGALYEHAERVTENGFLDIHVLTIDLHSAHLKLKTLASQTEQGLKETVTALANEGGAIAAVNGDFFGMAGDYSAPLGLEMTNGDIAAVSTSSNLDAMKNATLFVPENGLPYMGYVKTELSFYNNGQESFKLYALNHSTEFVLPTCINKNAYDTTAPIDKRFANLTKLVIENDYITYISAPGETVTLPEAEDGYIVVMDENTTRWNLSKFAVGQSAKLQVSATIDYSGISEAISGGGKILSNGYTAADGYYVTGRQPRTAIGISEDRELLIMMVVDGRNGLLGATHEEMADLLREYGAYNAMHLDGGGSSTMALKPHTDEDMEVVNRPSDGSQRRVINALGLVNESQFGTVQGFAAEAETDMVFKTMPLKINFFATDEYLNRSPIDYSQVSVHCNFEDGSYNNGYFYPSRTGEITLTALYGNYTADITIYSMELAQIDASRSSVKAELNSQTSIAFTGIGGDGFTANVKPSYLTAEVFPQGLATFRDGVLTGLAAGKGYMKFNYGAIEEYVAVEIGSKEVPIDFSDAQGRVLSYVASPSDNVGTAIYSFTPNGEPGLALTYNMKESAETQAAYAVFNPPVALPQDVISLDVSVYGDMSNNWLRGSIIDANGTARVIDFARHIDFDGQKTVTARIPSDVAYPISLERVYIAALENNFTEQGGRTIYLANLVANCPLAGDAASLPPSTVYKDGKNIPLATEKAAGEIDLRIIGDVTYNGKKVPEDFAAVQTKYLDAAITERDDASIVLGADDDTTAEGSWFKWQNKYSAYAYENFFVINLTSAKGSLYASDRIQWINLPLDLQNVGKNVLILTDNNPLNSIPSKEFELFSELLTKHVKQGKNITVLYSASYNANTVKDGVRYLGLEPLFQADGSVNQDFKTIKLRVSDDNTLWTFVPLEDVMSR